MDFVNVSAKFEVRSFTRSWYIRGYFKTLGSPYTLTLLFSVRMDPVNVPAKFEVRSITRSWDNRGTVKLCAVHGYAHARFSPKFLMGLCSGGPCEYRSLR